MPHVCANRLQAPCTATEPPPESDGPHPRPQALSPASDLTLQGGIQRRGSAPLLSFAQVGLRFVDFVHW